ncbi:hypothetical protein Ddc_22034 [Ditylenchus destructor]|nr:hypothetical protein Ddc_22034 [Ditylenchus destructor]
MKQRQHGVDAQADLGEPAHAELLATLEDQQVGGDVDHHVGGGEPGAFGGGEAELALQDGEVGGDQTVAERAGDAHQDGDEGVGEAAPGRMPRHRRRARHAGLLVLLPVGDRLQVRGGGHGGRCGGDRAIIQLDQHPGKPSHCVINDLRRCPFQAPGISRTQVHHAHLVHEGRPLCLAARAAERHREAGEAGEVAALRDRCHQHVAKLIELLGRQHQSRAGAALLIPKCWIERDGDDVAAFECFPPHHTSPPSGVMVSQSAMSAGGGADRSHWAIISASVYLRLGVNTILRSAVVSRFSAWPTLNPRSRSTVGGTINAVLLPIFFNTTSMTTPPGASKPGF